MKTIGTSDSTRRSAVHSALAGLFAMGLVSTGSPAEADFKGSIGTTVRDSVPYWPRAAEASRSAPNVLVILLDDVGFADLGAFGAEIETPNIDALANGGLRYNNFTTTAVCSPSRAALLTGLNHHSAGVGWLADMDSGYPGYRGEIHSNVMTMPEVLRGHGYSTFMVGKWHLTNQTHRSVAGPYDSWPTQRGFDRFWGTHSNSSQWMPDALYRGNEAIEVAADDDFYFPDAMTDTAIQMLKDLRAVARNKPFFLYYATGAAHAPHHTRAEDRAKYRGRYDAGYDRIRNERLARQKALGIVPPDTHLAPRLPGVEPWEDFTADEKKMYARLQENYAAFVDNIDQQVGRLIGYLRDSGQLDDTLIILTSDNGASKEAGIPGTTMRTRYLNGIADTTEKNLEDYDAVGSSATAPNYPIGWMQASNAPFPYAKGTTHGGGVRDPLIIHWPGGIADGGAVRPQFHHIHDLMPTVLEVAGAKVPSRVRGLEVKPIEGISMAYSFARGKIEGRRRKIVTYVRPQQHYDAVPWELYDLRSDFSETNDLAAEHPGKVRELEAKWWAAARRYDVLPLHDEPTMQRGRAAMSQLENLRFEQFRYEPGLSTIQNVQAPLLNGRSFSITATVDRDDTAQQGVLVALGGLEQGYSWYVRDNRLVYEVNVGGYRTVLESHTELPVGRITLAAHFELDEDAREADQQTQPNDDFSAGDFSAHHIPQGILTLYLDGQPVGSRRFAPVVPFSSWEGLDVGRDLRTPVSNSYAAPFAFSGELHEVVYRFDATSRSPER